MASRSGFAAAAATYGVLLSVSIVMRDISIRLPRKLPKHRLTCLFCTGLCVSLS